MMFMRVAILVIPIWLGLAGSSISAVRNDSVALYEGIAACLGRYSAQLEFAATVGDNPHDQRDLHAYFSDLYAALDTGRDLLTLRISAKHAHARLLWTANARDNPKRARLAAARIAAQLTTCQGLVLR